MGFAMEIHKMLSELRAERERLNEAILAIERLAVGEPRRGRPPKDLSADAPTLPAKKKRGRPSMSEEQKVAQSLKMKAYWEKRKAAAK